MNIVYLKIEYCKSNIKIFNKKLKYSRYIDKCNQFCNSINPLYCNNCLLKVLSDYNLNYYFSDYILYNDNDFYHVLRNSINFNQNIYNNYYNDYYENINYQENENYFHHMHNNTLHYIDINEYDSKNEYTEESNYNFDNSTIKSNTLSEITLDKSLKNLNKEEDNNLKDDEEISLNNNFDIKNLNKEENNNLKDDEELNLNNNFDIKNKEISLNTDKNNNENSNFNNNYNEKTNNHNNEINDIKSNNEIKLNNENSNNQDKEINNNYEENNTDKNNLNSDIENKEILSDNSNVENTLNKQYLKKQRKKERRKERKKERKIEEKKNQEKDNEELELINKAINSNKLELLEKIKKLNLDEDQYDLIKNLSYAELNEKMSNPITYDMKEKFQKIFEENKNLNLFKFIDNILEDDFNTLAKENKELVDDMKIYLNENKFNKFYFYSIYELMYNEKLNMFIIDNKQKTYDIQYPKIKYSYDLIFYEHINDKKINNFFSTYLDEIFLKPYVEQKKIELKDKYDSYEQNLFKKKNLVTFEERLLIYNYEKDNLKKKKLGGNIILGMRGGIKFNRNNNNIDKIYF